MPGFSGTESGNYAGLPVEIVKRCRMTRQARECLMRQHNHIRLRRIVLTWLCVVVVQLNVAEITAFGDSVTLIKPASAGERNLSDFQR